MKKNGALDLQEPHKQCDALWVGGWGEVLVAAKSWDPNAPLE